MLTAKERYIYIYMYMHRERERESALARYSKKNIDRRRLEGAAKPFISFSMALVRFSKRKSERARALHN